MTIDAPMAMVLAAGFSFVSGLLVAQLNGRRQERLELNKWENSRLGDREKWRQDREDERRKQEHAWLEELRRDARIALSSLMRHLAAAAQNACWLTWRACHEPELLTEKHVSDYDEQMAELLPEIVSTHVTVAALDENAEQVVRPLIDQLYGLDHEVGLACTEFKLSLRKDPPAPNFDPLAKLSPKADAYRKWLLDGVRGAIDSAKQKRQAGKGQTPIEQHQPPAEV